MPKTEPKNQEISLYKVSLVPRDHLDVWTQRINQFNPFDSFQQSSVYLQERQKNMYQYFMMIDFHIKFFSINNDFSFESCFQFLDRHRPDHFIVATFFSSVLNLIFTFRFVLVSRFCWHWTDRFGVAFTVIWID